MFTVTMVEVDQTVGNPDAQVVRQYPLTSTDTLPHALRVAREYESKLTGTLRTTSGNPSEYVSLLVDHGRHDEYGNIYRTTYVLVGFGDEPRVSADKGPYSWCPECNGTHTDAPCQS